MVIPKKELKPIRAQIIRKAERVTQIALSRFKGIHVQTRLIYPVKRTSKVESEENSSGLKVVVFAFSITIIKTLINITKAAGTDFFKT